MKSSIMVRNMLVTGFVTALLISGCSSDDSSSGNASNPVDGCKALFSLFCKNVFGCFSTDQLDPASFGNNEADCKTKLSGTNCTEVKTKCASGKEYKPSAGKECLDQFDALSCDQLENLINNGVGSPAACEQDQLCQ